MIMREIKSLISEAIKNKNTLIAEHCYCEIIKEPITLEVYPYKLDGDFLICYDLSADQPYVIISLDDKQVFSDTMRIQCSGTATSPVIFMDGKIINFNSSKERCRSSPLIFDSVLFSFIS